MNEGFPIRATHAYLVCGWRTHSEIPLTGVRKAVNDGGNFDVIIQIATGQSPILKNTGQLIEHSTECSLIRIKGVADFEINYGRQITIWPAAGATHKDIEIYLFGVAWATLCHQRGLLPLHASAIVSGGYIRAFAGHPGAGKSSTAALLGSLGYELIADDILPVSFDQNSVPGAWPYLRRLKLREDSINQLALTPTEPVSERLDKEKYFVHPRCAADDRWSRLERLYLLEIGPDSRVSIDRINGAEAVRVLIDQTYHLQFIVGGDRLRDHFAFCTRLASKISVYRLLRPRSFNAMKELAPRIREHLAQ
jgi:hypothetical protein